MRRGSGLHRRWTARTDPTGIRPAPPTGSWVPYRNVPLKPLIKIDLLHRVHSSITILLRCFLVILCNTVGDE